MILRCVTFERPLCRLCSKYSATSISGGILGLLCSFPYKWTSRNGEVGNGDLELSEVIFSIQMTSIIGTRDHFLLILPLYVVNYTILIEQSKEIRMVKNLLISASYPIVDSKYLHSSHG